MESIQIIDYLPQYQVYFEKFNKAWIAEHATVEPIDEWVLQNPEDAILKDGGKILFAQYNGQIIGTAAIRLIEPGIYELTKMTVDKTFRGHGAGKVLCEKCIQLAKELGAYKIVLYSQSVLTSAIKIYHDLGFVDVPLKAGIYKRADVKMELQLMGEANSKTGIQIIEADEKHLNELAGLFNAYRMFYKKDTDVPAAKMFISDRLMLKDSKIFLAVTGNKVVGFTQLYPLLSSVAMKRLWLLNDLYVSPECRKQGIATVLIDKARALATETSARGLVLETEINNKTAQRLYESIGFVREQTSYFYNLDV